LESLEQDNFHDDPHADLVRILKNFACSPDPKTNLKIRYSQVPIKRVGPNKQVGWLF
jgi:hypothetical protein